MPADDAGEKGFGHIIEGVDGPEGGGDGYEVEEAEKNGGTIGRCVAAATCKLTFAGRSASRLSDRSSSSSLANGVARPASTSAPVPPASPTSATSSASTRSTGRKCWRTKPDRLALYIPGSRAISAIVLMWSARVAASPHRATKTIALHARGRLFSPRQQTSRRRLCALLSKRDFRPLTELPRPSPSARSQGSCALV